MKCCNVCGAQQNLENSCKNPNAKHGLQSRCKKCANAANKAQREADPRREKNKSLLREFGTTVDTYETLLAQQNGCCAICNKHWSRFTKLLDVDHDHNTGQVRALLCNPCNQLLGQYEKILRLNLAPIYDGYLSTHGEESKCAV